MSKSKILEDEFVFKTDKAEFFSNLNTKVIDSTLAKFNPFFKCYKAVRKDGINYIIVDHELGSLKFEGDSGWQSVLNYLSYLKYERSVDEAN